MMPLSNPQAMEPAIMDRTSSTLHVTSCGSQLLRQKGRRQFQMWTRGPKMPATVHKMSA